LQNASVEASSCTLCGACSLVCPTEAISVEIDYVGATKDFEAKEICIGCIKSDKAEVILPCIANLNEKDILNIQKTKGFILI
jgi:ferredoxin